MRRLRFAITFLLVLALTPVVGTTADAGGILTWTGTVIRVVDGDTFDVRLTNGTVQTIRLAGINTNETARDPNCWADEATDRLTALISGKTVKLKARFASSSAQGRPFRHAFIGKTNVAEKLLKEGYGVPFVGVLEDDYIDRYVAAFYSANAAGLRIHNPDACGAGPPASLEFLVNGDADGSDVENLNGEYVQIRNTASTPLSLAGWKTHDSAVGYYTFPASTTIAPGGVLRVHVGSGTDSSTDLYMGFSKPIYSRLDGAFLLDPDNDMRAFQTWPCGGICGGSALPRIVIDAVQADGPGNDNDNPNVEWIRIRNADAQPVDLQDWSFVSLPHLVYSDESRVLQPGETLTLFVGQGTNTRTELYWGKTKSILNKFSDKVAVISPAGDVADCRAWGDETCSNSRARGFERTSSDFDGDGYDDLAVGVAGEDLKTRKNAGSVVVIPGTKNGIVRKAGRIWTQSGRIANKPKSGDKFGSTLAMGDFNGDGYDDLAIGVPGEDVNGANNAGLVNIIYGSRRGLRAVQNRSFSHNGAIVGDPEAYARFGDALATGDFNGDGYDDLAIGVAGEDVDGAKNAGMINIIYGSSDGLTTAGNVAFTQGAGNVEAGDTYGSALAAGDFDGNGYDDLVVGSPGENSREGQVNLLYGSSSGLASDPSDTFSQAGAVSGDAEQGDAFGAALAAGDINGDGYDDFAAGSPGEAIGALARAGQVNVLYGSANGVTTSGNKSFSQAGSILGSPTAGDRFGGSVAIGDFDGDGYDDLVVGVHRERRSSKKRAGAFHVIYGGAGGATSASNKLFDQGAAGGTPEAGDQFATAIRLIDIDGDSRVDVVAGALRENLNGVRDAGAVGVVFGRSRGYAPPRSGLSVSQDGAVPGKSERNDHFGDGL